MSNIISWQDTRGSQGNSYAKPFVLQMLSPNGWLLTRKVNGVPISVQYDEGYVHYKLYNEAIKPFENTFMTDGEVFEKVVSLLEGAMKYRNPNFTRTPANTVEAVETIDATTSSVKSPAKGK